MENQGGASGALAAQRVLRATPDGYTLLFGTTSDMVVTPMTVTARPGLGVNNLDQLVALAKQKPNGISVGTTGNASLQAFAAVALQRAAGIDLLGIPYKGGAPMLNDLMGGGNSISAS